MDVRYFPNPSNGNFALVLSSAMADNADIQISTVDGKLVYVAGNVMVYGITTLNINLNPSTQGAYLLHIRCGSGELTDKLLIKK